MNLKRIATILNENPDILVRSVVLDTAQRKGQVIHGARALNPQLPTYLRKETSDYDILTTKPKKSAQEVLERLKRYTSKPVSIEKAVHKGTYKVKVGDEYVADYTQIKSNPKTKKILGVKYQDVSTIKRNIQKRLKDPSKEFRKEKDSDSLRRIKISEDTFNF